MFIPDNFYKQIVEYSVISTVDIIFMDHNKSILLGRRSNSPLKGEYYIPWGRIRKNETIIQGVQRKAKEEFNIDIDINKLVFVGSYDDIFEDSAWNTSTHCVPRVFAYQLNNDEVKMLLPDTQHTDIKFAIYNDPSLHPFLKQRLETIQSDYQLF